MDTDKVTRESIGALVRGFLKAEVFYLAVVVFVVVIGALQTAREFRNEPTGRPGTVPVDSFALKAGHSRKLTILAKENPEAVRFPMAVSALHTVLFHAGLLAILTLAIIKAARGRLLAGKKPGMPVWNLWDFLKLGSVFIVGLWLFHFIFRTDEMSTYLSRNALMAEVFGRVLLVGVMIHIVLYERGGRIADLGIRRGGVLRGIGIGLLAFLVLQPVFPLLERAQWKLLPYLPLQETAEALLRAKSTTVLILSTLTAIVVAPVSEEMFFRGLLQPALRRWVSPAPAILLSAAFFATAHMDLFRMPDLLVLGIMLGYLYNRTQSLAAPVALHLAHNGMVMLTIFAHRSLAATPI